MSMKEVRSKPKTLPKVELHIFDEVRLDLEIAEFLRLADEHMGVIGYTEHGLRHALRVANWAGMVLDQLGRPQEEAELARASGYLHDIGNFICRANHGQAAAAILYSILKPFPLTDRQLGLLLSAVGNHEEQYGQVYNNICAAVMIADKSDVHRSRVRHYDPKKGDIHDNVNYAVTESKLSVLREEREIRLELTIDPAIASVMDYFEIFIDRMVMCRKASTFLGCSFSIIANRTKLS